MIALHQTHLSRMPTPARAQTPIVVNIALPLVAAGAFGFCGDYTPQLARIVGLILCLAAFACNAIAASTTTFATTLWFFVSFFIFVPAATNMAGFWIGGTQDLHSGAPLALALLWISFTNIGLEATKIHSMPAMRTPIQLAAPGLVSACTPILTAIQIALAGYFALHRGEFLTDRYHGSFQAILHNTRPIETLGAIDFPRALAFATFAFCILSVAQRPSMARLLQTLAGFVIYALYNNPMSTQRQVIFTQIVFLAILLGVSRRRRIAFWLLVMFGLFFVGPLVSYFSRERFYGVAPSFFHGTDFDAYQNSQVFWKYINSRGALFSPNILYDFSFFLPREFKPRLLDLPRNVAAAGGYAQANISLPIFNQFYADFGLLSLAVYSLLFGIVAGLAESGGLWLPRSRFMRLFPLYFVASTVALCRGPLLGNLPYIAMGAAAFGILGVICFRRTPPASDRRRTRAAERAQHAG